MSLDILTKKEFSAAEWAQYYKNIWFRNMISHTIDVEVDTVKKAEGKGELEVKDDPTGLFVPLKQRLEMRRERLETAVWINEGATRLFAMLQEEGGLEKVREKYWSEAALAVAADMDPNQPVAAPGTETKPADVIERTYEVMQEFNGIKVGEILKIVPGRDGWTDEVLAEKVQAGILKIKVE